MENLLALNYTSVRQNEFELICQKWYCRIVFHFITVDGAESGIGAAPLFSDAVGMPIEPALIFVNKTLISLNIRDKIRVMRWQNNLRLLHT
jgi:hypothetical protein